VDFVVLVRTLYKLSKESAAATDGNCSRFAYCGIPMLLSAIRCLVIEYESFRELKSDILEKMTGTGDLLSVLDHYNVPEPLRTEVHELIEIRNEIIHPAHLPSGTPDNWPNYLRGIKERGLLQSSGNPSADYILLDQIASHRLFTWACRVTRDLAKIIIESSSEKAESFRGFVDSYETIGFENQE